MQPPSGTLSWGDRLSFSSACSRDLDTLIGSSCRGSSELENNSNKGRVLWVFFFNLSIAAPSPEAGRARHVHKQQRGQAMPSAETLSPWSFPLHHLS